MKRDKTIALVVPGNTERRQLNSLLAAEGFLVESFGQREEFVSDIDLAECGCLILDVDLAGGSTPDWKLLEFASRWSSRLPIIVLSSDPSQLPTALPFEVASKEAGEIPLLSRLYGVLDQAVSLKN